MKIITFLFLKDYNFNMFESKFVVKQDEADSLGEIKISALLRNMQEVATDHANKLKIGRDELMKENNIWVVVRTDLKILRLPKLKEKYIISTHPGETKGFMFPRYFQVYDKHRNLLVTVSSIWVVVNFDTRRIILHPFKDATFPFESDPNDLEMPLKVNEEAPYLLDKRVTKQSEVDVNIHINNTYYFDYVLDVHDEEFYKENRVSRILLNYEKEIIHPSEIELYSSKNNPEIIIGKVDGNISFASKVEFQKR